jgi:hypothetical protein
MLNLRKLYVLDENQQPVAVQIPIAAFERIEEILENYGLAHLISELPENTEPSDPLEREDASNDYRLLISNGVITPPAHRQDISPVSNQAWRELMGRLAQISGKPLSEIIIEERDVW